MLSAMLSADLFKWLLIFARIGAGAMFLPGFSSSTVNTRVRLIFALLLAFILMPTLGPKLPPPPSQPLALFMLLAGEITIGVFIGILTQTMISALDQAGNSISSSVGLTNMFVSDPISEQQSQLMTGFLSLLAMTLIFVTDTHHLMLRALIDSYELVQPGKGLPTDDLAQTVVRTLSAASMIGLRLSAPLMVFTVTFNSGLALLNRMVPQIQVFFVGLPIQIFGGMSILLICLPAIMLLFMNQLIQGLSTLMSFG
jgi:flagellar biosynthetic protein FliR